MRFLFVLLLASFPLQLSAMNMSWCRDTLTRFSINTLHDKIENNFDPLLTVPQTLLGKIRGETSGRMYEIYLRFKDHYNSSANSMRFRYDFVSEDSSVKPRVNVIVKNPRIAPGIILPILDREKISSEVIGQTEVDYNLLTYVLNDLAKRVALNGSFNLVVTSREMVLRLNQLLELENQLPIAESTNALNPELALFTHEFSTLRLGLKSEDSGVPDVLPVHPYSVSAGVVFDEDDEYTLIRDYHPDSELVTPLPDDEDLNNVREAITEIPSNMRDVTPLLENPSDGFIASLASQQSRWRFHSFSSSVALSAEIAGMWGLPVTEYGKSHYKVLAHFVTLRRDIVK